MSFLWTLQLSRPTWFKVDAGRKYTVPPPLPVLLCSLLPAAAAAAVDREREREREDDYRLASSFLSRRKNPTGLYGILLFRGEGLGRTGLGRNENGKKLFSFFDILDSPQSPSPFSIVFILLSRAKGAGLMPESHFWVVIN